jgi:hypothetical protein
MKKCQAYPSTCNLCAVRKLVDIRDDDDSVSSLNNLGAFRNYDVIWELQHLGGRKLFPSLGLRVSSEYRSERESIADIWPSGIPGTGCGDWDPPADWTLPANGTFGISRDD